jgi:hypothetical protein
MEGFCITLSLHQHKLIRVQHHCVPLELHSLWLRRQLGPSCNLRLAYLLIWILRQFAPSNDEPMQILEC